MKAFTSKGKTRLSHLKTGLDAIKTMTKMTCFLKSCVYLILFILLHISNAQHETEDESLALGGFPIEIKTIIRYLMVKCGAKKVCKF